MFVCQISVFPFLNMFLSLCHWVKVSTKQHKHNDCFILVKSASKITDSPTSNATNTPLILCSRTFSMTGLGPLLVTVRALAWVTERTVAALSQGTPKMALRPPMATRSSRSKWNPEPLTIFLSGLLMISLDRSGEKEEELE